MVYSIVTHFVLLLSNLLPIENERPDQKLVYTFLYTCDKTKSFPAVITYIGIPLFFVSLLPPLSILGKSGYL
jgi:hypothetical protein